jgi:hypothetical protein
MEWITGTSADLHVEPISDTAEIVANLWYVMDDQGFIYSLRIKLYVCEGSEDDKLEFLKSRAFRDYLVARPFSVPKRFSTRFHARDGNETKYPVVHHDNAVALAGIDQLFFDGLDEMQKDLPAQTKLTIPESPLIKVTALVNEGDGNIVPLDVIQGREH